MITDRTAEIVLLDIKMPGMDGIEVLKRIREIDSRIPVVMVSVIGELCTAVSLMKLGAAEYLEKPCDAATMKNVVKRVLEERSRNRGFLSPSLRALVSAVVNDMVKVEEPATLDQAKLSFETRLNELMARGKGMGNG